MEPQRYLPAAEDDLRPMCEMLGWSFGFPPDDAMRWLGRAGIDNLRVVRRGERVDACLVLIPHAQFFAGQSVPAMGVAGVATTASARGTGAAVFMMGEMVRELHARGIALSNLYPASLQLYRRVGYELAGARWETKVPLSVLPKSERALGVRDMTPEDHPRVHALYRAHAARTNGFLDRGPYVWARVHEPRDARARGFVVEHNGALVGYTVFHEKRGGELEYSLVTTDLVATTAAAASRLLTLFADHGTLGDTVTWFGEPNGAFAHLVPALGAQTRLQHHWMIRMVDVKKALEARGWPEAARAKLALDVHDDLVDANAGRWTLTVESGKATLERGGDGGLVLDVRALAALYSGHMTARALSLAGALRGDDDAIARADAVFATSVPSLVDFF